jgi:hypothetical protein
MLRLKMVQTYKGLSMTEPMTERGTRFTFLWSTSHSNDGNRGSGIKRATNTKQAKGLNHIFLDRRGLRTREEKQRLEPALLRPSHHGTDKGWKKGDTIPRSKPTCRAPRLCN